MYPYRYCINLESEIQHSQASVPIAPLQRALLALSTQSKEFPSSRVIPVSHHEILHSSQYLLPSEVVFLIDTFIGRFFCMKAGALSTLFIVISAMPRTAPSTPQTVRVHWLSSTLSFSTKLPLLLHLFVILQGKLP